MIQNGCSFVLFPRLRRGNNTQPNWDIIIAPRTQFRTGRLFTISFCQKQIYNVFCFNYYEISMFRHCLLALYHISTYISSDFAVFHLINIYNFCCNCRSFSYSSRSRSFSSARFSIRETYERDMPSFSETSRWVSALPPYSP